MAREQKLSQADIDNLVYTVRKEYDDYIIRFEKPLKVKSDFEERYFQARKSNIKLKRFLDEEMRMIVELKRRELTKRNKTAFEKMNPNAKKSANGNTGTNGKNGKAGKKDFADKVLEQLHAKIEHYPEVVIHQDASYDLKKLFGALNEFGNKYWPDLQYRLQTSAIPGYGRFYAQFHSKAMDLWTAKLDDLPPVLRRYQTMLSRRPQNWDAIEKEQMFCMREASFFLHSVLHELDRVNENDDSSDKEAREYIDNIIHNFRLMYFKPQNL